MRNIPIAAVAALIAAGSLIAATSVAFAQDRSNRARSACASAGLNPSEAPFVYCVQAAMQSVSEVAPDDNMARARHVCSAMGYAGEAYATCVGNVDQTLFDQQNFLTR
jgi:hypothetical protein